MNAPGRRSTVPAPGLHTHPVPAALLAFALLLPGGCAHYSPRPLTPEAIEQRLQAPPPDRLQVLAGQLHHPLLPPLALHPDQDLTPDSAALLAVLLNPGLRAARDRRGLADAQLLAAGLLPDPELDLGLEFPTGAAPGRVTAYGLGLSWEATALLARSPRQASARAATRQVDLDIAWQEWQVALGAKAAVYRLRLLEDRLDLARQVAGRAGQTLQRVDQAVAAGALTDAALQAARQVDFQARAATIELERQVAVERQQLRRLLGLPAAAALRLAKGIPLPQAAALPPVPDLLRGLEQRRLDLVALRQGYASQEAALRAAILKQFPKIRLGPEFRRDTDGVKTVGFSVAIDLPLFDRNRGPIAVARASRQQLFDEYADRLFTARADVAALREGLDFLDRQLALDRAAAASERKRSQRYAAGLAAGRVDARAAAGAWQDWAAARMRVLQREENLTQARVALELATGLYNLPPAATAAKGTSP